LIYHVHLQIDGYQLLQLNTSNNDSIISLFEQKHLYELGGSASRRVFRPFTSIRNYNMTEMDTFAVRAYNLIGESSDFDTIKLVDWGPPTTVATNLLQSPDSEPRVGYVTVDLEFTLPVNQTTGHFGTSGYR
jgi:hypothetical protein